MLTVGFCRNRIFILVALLEQAVALTSSSRMDGMPTLRHVSLVTEFPKTLENSRILKSASHFYAFSSHTTSGTAIALFSVGYGLTTWQGADITESARQRRKRNVENQEFSS